MCDSPTRESSITVEVCCSTRKRERCFSMVVVRRSTSVNLVCSLSVTPFWSPPHSFFPCCWLTRPTPFGNHLSCSCSLNVTGRGLCFVRSPCARRVVFYRFYWQQQQRRIHQRTKRKLINYTMKFTSAVLLSALACAPVSAFSPLVTGQR